MPLVNRTFDQLIDFTRTSAGTFVGSNGLIQTTPASVNLLTFSQDFDSASWSKSAITATANVAVAPDGTPTADKIVATATTAFHGISRSLTGTAVSYVFSVYAKAAEYSKLILADGAGARWSATFDLATGATIATGGAAVLASSIQSAGNGWYRCDVTFTGTVSNTAHGAGGYPDTGATLNNFGATYTGDGTSGIFIWGAQLEIGSTATTYTRNFGGLFPPRFDFDPVSLAPRGLLIEEQRTNLLLYSEQFDNAYWTASAVTVTANTSVSPDGLTTADTIDDGLTTGLHRVFRASLTMTAAAQTFSCFVKAGTGVWFQLTAFDGTTSFYANFNVSTGVVGNKSAAATSSITPFGNGWYRCVMTATTAATAAGNFQVVAMDADTAIQTPSFTGANRTWFVWGVQHEAGAFATSYIPTVASQVTRTSDVALIQTPNFAPWYNQPQGTFFVEFTPDTTVASVNVRVLTVSQAAAAGRVVDIYPNVGIWTTFNGTTNLATGAATVTSTPQKFAAAFASGSYAACLNGGTVATATTATVNSPTQMTIGHFPTATNFINGHIRSIRFYPTRLNDAQLQALTV